MAEEERLRAAIEKHRLAVGYAYGIGSFKRLHAVNMELWEAAGIYETEELQEIVEAVEQNDELHRPAMLESDD